MVTVIIEEVDATHKVGRVLIEDELIISEEIEYVHDILIQLDERSEGRLFKQDFQVLRRNGEFDFPTEG